MDNFQQLKRNNQSSIEFARNAKGEPSWTVKRYYDETIPEESSHCIDAVKFIDAAMQQIFKGKAE